MTISPDGHTGILIAGANASTDDMVKAVDEVKGELTELSGDGIEVYPTGSSALWSDFNKANHDAMIQAELFSWPVTLAIMVLAFGSSSPRDCRCYSPLPAWSHPQADSFCSTASRRSRCGR
ncbi:hypothetical protein GCM10020255_006720 [Rhodococcus baikonurensis]